MTYNMSDNGFYDLNHPGFEVSGLFDESDEAVERDSRWTHCNTWAS